MQATSPDRHHQGIGDELCRDRGAHRPADDTAGEEIDKTRDLLVDDGQQNALCGERLDGVDEDENLVSGKE